MNHESTITEVFWGNVNRLMSQKGMNIYSLAESCGLARRSLERSRQRNAVPDGYNTFLIARSLDVTVETLFSEGFTTEINLETEIKSLDLYEQALLGSLLTRYLSKKSSD